MSDIIFGLLPEIWSVSMIPFLFIALTAVGLVGLILMLIRG